MTKETKETKQEDNVKVGQEEKDNKKKTYNESNKACISGRIEEELKYSHSVLWEKFYRTKVRVKRLSGAEDLVPIIVSDLLLEKEMLEQSAIGKWVEIAGQFRSHNKWGADGHKHLELFLFAMNLNVYDSEEQLEENTNMNSIYLDGYLCKLPIYRKTPLGRDITDIYIAVNRDYGKSDYIPCIAWGRIAQCAKDLVIGNRVRIYGRVQSRQYFKRYAYDSAEGEFREAYEISVMRMETVED